MATADQERYPLWSRGDLDGFFGLMVDNLVQVLLIVALCTFVVQLPAEFVYQRILPGVAVSLLIGNLFYGLQARRVARRQGNPTCTALPYGINTPSVVAYAYFVMAPQYQLALLGGATPERAAELAWLAGIAACLVSGLVEFVGAFCAERLRRVTPRAALLGVLAAVGITFIASDFAFRLYTRPLVGVLPLGILLLAYFARYRFLWGLPGGFLAVLVGTVIAWGMSVTGTAAFGGAPDLSVAAVAAAAGEVRLSWPVFQGEALLTLLTSPDLIARFLAVSIPMGLMNVIGSLQNIESAEAGGDRFATGPSLAVNGLGSLAAGMFGSCFPTTIYIGHPGWKALGARAGYSILNGVFFTVAFVLGLGPLLAAVIPIEAGAAIVMYIGIIITAQAFQATPRAHAPAVAIALFPGLAALLAMMLEFYLTDSGLVNAFATLLHEPTPRTATLAGLLTLTGANSGWIIVTLLLTAMAAALIERQYRAAAVWSGVATVLTVVGLIHAYRVESNLVRELFIWQGWGAAETGVPSYAYRAWPIAIGYALVTGLLLIAARRQRGAVAGETPAPPDGESAPGETAAAAEE